ncbi:receptor-type tyrosine-protein phosphatase mu-like [Littorina saxatilis]|uniref:receptor-type tyrosine-protein phosphatase mu-like n=1 Tax=Littorina saxatilis TaxID=31220 RepID=UPI0038B6AE22
MNTRKARLNYSRVNAVTVVVVFSCLLAKTKGQPECACASSSDGGCVPSQPCDRFGNCNKENVAYGKAANISTRYRAAVGLSGPGCVAVNGRTHHVMRFLNEPQVNCLHSRGGLGNPGDWWQVDLGRNYTVSDLTIYNRETNPARVAGIWIYVDGQLCFKFPNSGSGALASYGKLFNVNCSAPLTGSVVRFAKDGVFSYDDSFLNFCEVQIWVCTSGLYGASCDRACSGHCHNNGTCDNYFGTCPDGCADGYYGVGCFNACGQCADNAVCDIDTGHCPAGCEPGYQLPLCQDPCSNRTYGENCSQQCGQCADLSPCDVTTGHCDACQGIFSMPLCKECLDGRYGPDCSNACGHCKNDAVCDKDTGNCPEGCSAGYQPPDCQQECNNRTYGEDCALSCGNCAGKADCNIFHGSCLACEKKFILPFCKALKQTSSAGNGNSQGGVIGGVVGAILAVALLAALAGFFVFRRKRNKKEQGANESKKTETRFGGKQSHVAAKHPATKEKPIPKPSAAVKPTIHQPLKNASAENHVYVNVTLSNTSSSRRRPSLSSTITRSSEDDEEETRSLEENGHVCEDDAYASFRAEASELDRVQEYLVDRLASGALRDEFKTIPKVIQEEPQEAGNLQKNIRKNRFAQVMPYDRNRVILTDGYAEGSATDFVNASYIRGFQSERAYIAAQGPRDNTVGDLWRMIWQEKISTIVMLTNISEGGKAKCKQYWPEEESNSSTYGPVTVTLTHTQRRDNFYIRTLTIKVNEETREVTQCHYVSWPDHGVPTTTSLVRFWRYVTNRSHNDSGPLLVHCSAGVGRTGTFIGLDIGVQAAIHDGSISVLDIVRRLRDERTLMVQAIDQYSFLHEALLEAYTARDTVVPLDKVDVIFPEPITAEGANTRIDQEFETLMHMRALTSEPRHDIPLQEENVTKNRNPDALPLDTHIAFLTEHVEGRNQYINAVLMPTFLDPKGSILTQLPLPSTLVDFWRLVYGNDVTTIVSLSSRNEEQEVTPYCQYWSKEEDGPIQTGPYTIYLQSKTSVMQSLTSYMLTVEKKGLADVRPVQLLHYDGWSGEVGCEAGHMLQLLNSLNASAADSADLQRNQKIVIQCSDGVSKSGLFSALHDVMDCMTYDREIDVYMTARHVHSVAPHAVLSLEQYRYCYEIAQRKYRDMSVYANT